MNILDQPTFVVNDPDARELLDQLIRDYALQAPVKVIAATAGISLSDVFWEKRMKDVWPELLEAAANRGRLRILVEVILAETDAAAPRVLLQRLLSLRPDRKRAEPYLANVLAARRSFLDRVMFRGCLEDLASSDGSRVLVVTGPKDSGKTHSWYLINYVAECLGVNLRRVDLSTYTGREPADALVVAKAVASRLGWQPDPTADASNGEDNAVFTLTNWFVGRMAEAKGPWWLVFDGLNAPLLGEYALRMVESIAAVAARQEAGDLRVVLLAFEQSLTTDAEQATLREVLTTVGSDDIENFFRAVAAEAGTSLDAGALSELVGQLLGPPPHPTVISLPDIGPRAGQLASALLDSSNV